MNPILGMAHVSWEERVRRCYFLATEALLDRALIEHVLIDSLKRFKEENVEYPFVRTAELKPGGLGPTIEHALHNTALVLFLENEFPPDLKPYIRVRKKNELVSRNLHRFTLPDPESEAGIASFRELVNTSALDTLRPLLHLDMALVAQRRGEKKSGLCYEFSHFHVMIDAVLDAIIEDYGIELRYLSRSLYEQGEEYAALLEMKFFEQFGMKTTASGRRTAALVAHRLLSRRLPGLHVVYCGSTESRCLYKLHHDGTLSRVVLIPIYNDDIKEIVESHAIAQKEFEANYLLPISNDVRAGILYVRNAKSAHARPPLDRKLRREIATLERWITTEQQLLLPLPQASHCQPLEWNWIYRTTPKASDE